MTKKRKKASRKEGVKTIEVKIVKKPASKKTLKGRIVKSTKDRGSKRIMKEVQTKAAAGKNDKTNDSRTNHSTKNGEAVAEKDVIATSPAPFLVTKKQVSKASTHPQESRTLARPLPLTKPQSQTHNQLPHTRVFGFTQQTVINTPDAGGIELWITSNMLGALPMAYIPKPAFDSALQKAFRALTVRGMKEGEASALDQKLHIHYETTIDYTITSVLITGRLGLE